MLSFYQQSSSNGCHLLKAHYTPGIMLNALYILQFLILKSAQEWYYYVFYKPNKQRLKKFNNYPSLHS